MRVDSNNLLEVIEVGIIYTSFRPFISLKPGLSPFFDFLLPMTWSFLLSRLQKLHSLCVVPHSVLSCSTYRSSSRTLGCSLGRLRPLHYCLLLCTSVRLRCSLIDKPSGLLFDLLFVELRQLEIGGNLHLRSLRL